MQERDAARSVRSGDPHSRPARCRGLTHTFISLADSYTPTVRRSWRCAATSSSSTAALTVCILGPRETGVTPGRPRGAPVPARPGRLQAAGAPLLTSAPRCRTPRALPVSCCSYNPQWKTAPRQFQGRKCKVRGRRAQSLPTEPNRSSRPSEGSEILPK